VQRLIRITGIVQGVGFRPYVWHLANELKLSGWVRNDAAGVEVLVQGSLDQLERFTQRLPQEIPPLAQVNELTWSDAPARDVFIDFTITTSGAGRAATMIGHDSAVCHDCLAEMFDPADRRWRYAFINCTHCGPRYTLTRKLPYDRAQTSMAAFPLCPDCEREYRDPANRRFHAEPTACPVCGPRLDFLPLTQAGEREKTAVADTLNHLKIGQIVALKGLGGFHLACDARNADAVHALRERKRRDEKPFAIMAANLASIADWVEISADEAALLQSPERPIVLLRKKPGVDAALPGIAPGLAWLGVMLPYTPLHWLLWHEAAKQPPGTNWMTQPQGLLLVMTSANPGGEPLVIGNDEAVERLAGIADALLLHDRDIVVRCDDSVVRSVLTVIPAQAGIQSAAGSWTPACAGVTASDNSSFQFIRRARGYTPRAIRLPRTGPSVLALGGYLKNTICVTRGDEAFVSQHIGGLDNPAACGMLIEVVQHLLDILQVNPAAIAHDLHPDFFSTRHALELAEKWGVPTVAVQHHHAHIAAVAAEHGITGPILGLALDGVGLGSDGTVWGGELLRVAGGGCTRLGHLSPIPLPGGDKAAKEPWRMAAAALHLLGRGEEIAGRFPQQAAAQQLHQLLERGLNTPKTSSLGRWFDAAAGLLGAREVMAYEGQAAMLLEGLAEAGGAVAPMSDFMGLGERGPCDVLDLLPLLAHLADEANPARGAAVFHATLVSVLADWMERTALDQGLTTVALGGGCFLNHILSCDLKQRLTTSGLTVLEARQVPPNDGGLSLGQAWVAIDSLT
jgi:hydrogenase maturation protein HypF